MSKDKLTDYDATASNNTDVGGISVAEGMLPSGVNNAIREQMSHLKDFASGTTGIDVLSLADDDASHSIKLQAPSAVTADTTFTLPDGDGVSGQTMITDGAGALSWAAPYGNRNLVINGAMTINQRGTQTGIRNSFGIDRFRSTGTGAQLFTFSQSTEVPSGQGFSYSLKLDVTTADTSVAAGDYNMVQHLFEGQDLQHLKYGTSSAKSLTLQFWVRSSKTGTHIVELKIQDVNYYNAQIYTIASANTWQKVILTFSGYQTSAITNDNTNGFGINWWLMAGSTYSGGTLASNTWQNTAANRAVGQVNVVDSTDNEFYITGVQLEIGDVATPFEHPRSFGDELLRCQRYHQKIDFLTSNGGISNSWYYANVNFLTTMRAAPTLSNTSAYGLDTGNASVTQGGSSVTGLRTASVHPTQASIYGMNSDLWQTLQGRLHFDAEL